MGEVYYDPVKDRFIARIKLGKAGWKYKYLGRSYTKAGAQKLIDNYTFKKEREKLVDRVLKNFNLKKCLVSKIVIESNKQGKYQYSIVEEALEKYFNER